MMISQPTFPFVVCIWITLAMSQIIGYLETGYARVLLPVPSVDQAAVEMWGVQRETS